MKLTKAIEQAKAEAVKHGLLMAVVAEGPHTDEFETDRPSYGYCPLAAMPTLYQHGELHTVVKPDGSMIEQAKNVLPAMHPDLLAVLVLMGVKAEQVSTRESDVMVLFEVHADAYKLKMAGPWKSMADVFKTNPEHPDAKKYPWGVDIPFARLSQVIAEKSAKTYKPKGGKL